MAVESRPTESLGETLARIEDLSDFCEKWLTVKARIDQIDIGDHVEDAAVQELMEWLVLLADRVCIDSTEEF